MDGMTRGGEALPILVLGSGQRCGSTLVQRLLSSHPEVLIWGEHGGHLSPILEASKTLELWDRNVSQKAREEYAINGYQSFMANLLPDPVTVAEAARAYLTTLFALPAEAQGRPRWGFKEVRFGLPEAEAIRELFAGTRVIHVTRDPRDILVSLDRWERLRAWWKREYTVAAIGDWVHVTQSFQPDPQERPWAISWRYEDVVAKPDRFTEAVAELLQLEVGKFDRSVFERRVSE